MKIFLTGATGFIGGETLRQLLAAGLQVRCLVRPEPGRVMDFEGIIEICPGDINQPAADWMKGCDAVINLVGITRENPSTGQTFQRINFEGVKNLIEGAKKAGIKRFIQMSAMGACEKANSTYQHSKYLADEHIRASGLDYVILQPGIVYGPHDNTISIFNRLIRWLPFFPLLKLASCRLQPMAASNLAEGLVKAAVSDRFHQLTIVAGGPEKFTFEQFVEYLGRLQDKQRPIWKKPGFLMEPAVRILEKFPWFPLNADKLHMLLHDNTCDPTPFFKTFDIEPIVFSRLKGKVPV
ncbi:MAG: NAD(P)H-binding protein [bacterium]